MFYQCECTFTLFDPLFFLVGPYFHLGSNSYSPNGDLPERFLQCMTAGDRFPQLLCVCNVFISLSFLMAVFIGYRTISVQGLCFFSTLKMSCHGLMTFIISGKDTSLSLGF